MYANVIEFINIIAFTFIREIYFNFNFVNCWSYVDFWKQICNFDFGRFGFVSDVPLFYF
jgi:hypothetical protein